jgi:prolyl-tRNA synthetase
MIEQILTDDGLIYRIGGEVAYTPKGKQIKLEIEGNIRSHLNQIAEEVELPVLIDYSTLKLNRERRILLGRLFSCFRTSSRDKTQHLLARTAEELAANYFSQNKKEGVIYQIKAKFRDEKSTELDFLKRREFTMLDAYSFDADHSESQKTYQKMKKCFAEILNDLGIPHSIQPAGDVCSNVQSEEFICGLENMAGVEVGHIYQMGNLYTKPYGLEQVMMGSYGLGIDRLFAAVAISRGAK